MGNHTKSGDQSCTSLVHPSMWGPDFCSYRAFSVDVCVGARLQNTREGVPTEYGVRKLRDKAALQ